MAIEAAALPKLSPIRPPRHRSIRRPALPRGRAARSSMTTPSSCSTATATSAPGPAGRTDFPRRHALPVRTRAFAQRHAAAAARLERARRQHLSDHRSDQSGHLCRRPLWSCRRTPCMSCAPSSWRDTAYQRLAIRNHGERPVECASRSSSTATSPTCSRCVDCGGGGAGSPAAGDGADHDGAQLRRARRRAAPHHAELRSGAERARRHHGVLSHQPCPRTRRERSFSSAAACPNRRRRFRFCADASRLAICAPPRRVPHGRDLERPVQRGDLPVHVRPVHADDQHAARAISLCGHPLVLDRRSAATA